MESLPRGGAGVSLILDCSAVLAWVHGGERTPEIEAVFDRVVEKGAIVPHLWHLEVANSQQAKAEEWRQPNKGMLLIALRHYPLAFRKRHYRAITLHAFMKASVASGATTKTDGLASHAGVPHVSHDPHVIGNVAAHIVLPGIRRLFSTSKPGSLASTTAYAAGIRKPTSTNTFSASTGANTGMPLSLPCLASRQATNPHHTTC
jgi:hypothetical protein